MARIRSIHPGIWTDEGFISVSDAARLLFIGLLTECDDRGIFEWKPLRLKMRLRAWDGELMEPHLNALAECGLIKQFVDCGRQFGAVKNFCKWQRPKSPQYTYPCPDEILQYVALEPKQEDCEQRGTALGRQLCEQQGGACYYCGIGITFYRKKTNSLEVDHKTPISKGGEDAIGNLVAACKPCNSLKRNMTEDEFKMKFAVGELLRLSSNHIAKNLSHAAKAVVVPLSGEITPQMEDGGGRRERRKKEEEPANAGSPSKGRFAFESGVIRLTEKDFNQWKQAFTHLDLRAELLGLSDWAAKQSSWFNAVSGALNKRNREVGIKIATAPKNGEGRPLTNDERYFGVGRTPGII